MTACSWRFYVASDFSIFFFDEKVDIPRNFSREVTSSFPCIKIFLFWFYRSRIWINRNRTLVGFDFNLNFFVYFCCIQPSCLCICMVPTWRNCRLKVVSRHFFFLYVERMKTIFLIKTAFYNKSSYLVIRTK